MTAVLLTASVILTLLPSPASAAAAPSAPDFGPVIDGYAAFQGQSTCDPTAKPGVVAVRDMLRATYGRADSGIVRACGVGGASEHKEGRALDFPFNANDAGQRAQADGLVAWLLATDRHGHAHALARRLGVMYIIWNRRIWMANSATWSSYSGPSPHTDHVHLSFGWPGALKQTTWWTSSVRPVDRTVGDVTGDGYADLTTVTAQGQLAVYGNVKLMPGSGGKPFQGVSWQTDNTNWSVRGGWGGVADVTVSDVTGDGYADLTAVTNGGELQVYGNISGYPPHAPYGGAQWTYPNWGGVRHIA